MPQHVFSSLSNGFLVDQVFWTNVFRDGVTTPGTTTQSQGRCEFKVVQITDTTLRSRGVNQDTCSFHHLTEVGNAFWLVVLVGVQTRSVTDTAHGNQFLGFLYRVFEIFRTVHGKRWRQFFMCKRLAFVDNFHFTDQDFGCCRNGKACEFSNFVSRLTHDSSVQRAIFQDNVLNGFQLFALQQVAAVAGETFTNSVVHGIDNNNRLFRCTDHAVIEGFRHQYRRNGTFDVSGFVDNNRGVTRAHTDCWFTGAVCGFNHARTTGRQDQVNVRVMHQRIGELNGRLVDPANQIFWCASSDRRLQDNICRFVGRVFRTWVWREDDCVTSLQANQ
ncbi:Uncharacterised protein [Enterobacter asburiae]|nr:Uncharacterised protein [Enterobacter cloacae]SAF89688.1 Uncharacterised protein [Enterobacter asburiae]